MGFICTFSVYYQTLDRYAIGLLEVWTIWLEENHLAISLLWNLQFVNPGCQYVLHYILHFDFGILRKISLTAFHNLKYLSHGYFFFFQVCLEHFPFLGNTNISVFQYHLRSKYVESTFMFWASHVKIWWWGIKKSEMGKREMRERRAPKNSSRPPINISLDCYVAVVTSGQVA